VGDFRARSPHLEITVSRDKEKKPATNEGRERGGSKKERVPEKEKKWSLQRREGGK